MRALFTRDVVLSNGYIVDARAYGASMNDTTISAAIAAIGSDERVLLVTPGTWSISNDLTIPANITLEMLDGAILDIAAGKLLTINGKIEAGVYQIFDGPFTVIGHTFDPTVNNRLVAFDSKRQREVCAAWWGAIGRAAADDTADDTAAIQAMLDCGAMSMYIPGGYYMVRAENGVANTGLWLRGDTHLKMAKDTVLKAITVAGDINYRVMSARLVDDITVEGGTIQGERTTHGGLLDKNGHGLVVESCDNVTIRDVVSRDGWGDGFAITYYGVAPYAECTNVTMINCVADNSRRNGCSIVGLIGGKIIGCEFNNSNGAAPQDGIDIEPNTDRGDGNPSVVADLAISGSRLYGNTAVGVEIYASADDSVRNISVTGCVCNGNAVGIRTRGNVTGTSIVGNTCYGNTTAGISAYDSQNMTIVGNSCFECNSGILLLTSGAKIQNIIVNDNLIRDNSGHGIYCSTSSGHEIEWALICGNVIEGNAGRGISGLYILYGEINGNIVRGNGARGISMTSCDYCLTNDNIVFSNDYEGIALDGSDDNMVRGNKVNGNSQNADDTYSNISLSASDRNLVESNVVTHGGGAKQPKYGIIVANNTCDNNVLRSNIVIDSGKSGDIYDLGTGTCRQFNKSDNASISGGFTCANNATTTITNANVTAASRILIFPTNAAAAALMLGADSLYVSAKTPGTSFAVATAGGGAAAGTETFDYLII